MSSIEGYLRVWSPSGIQVGLSVKLQQRRKSKSDSTLQKNKQAFSTPQPTKAGKANKKGGQVQGIQKNQTPKHNMNKITPKQKKTPSEKEHKQTPNRKRKLKQKDDDSEEEDDVKPQEKRKLRSFKQAVSAPQPAKEGKPNKKGGQVKGNQKKQTPKEQKQPLNRKRKLEEGNALWSRRSSSAPIASTSTTSSATSQAQSPTQTQTSPTTQTGGKGKSGAKGKGKGKGPAKRQELPAKGAIGNEPEPEHVDIVIDEDECLVQGHGLESEKCTEGWDNCKKKKRNHKHFYPIGDISVEWLPQDINTNVVLNHIKNRADHTVRLRVKYIEIDQETNIPKNMVSYGTATVLRIEEIVPLPGVSLCQCFPVSIDPHQKKQWLIILTTAYHNTKRDRELKDAWVDFFYDDKESLHDGRLVSLQVGHLGGRYTEETDWCAIHCVTDNADLLKKLKANPFPLDDPEDFGNHIIIVSHPHGMPKKVSKGKRISGPPRDPNNVIQRTIKYTTPTCRGSSGARISGDPRYGGFNVHQKGDKWGRPNKYSKAYGH